MPIEVTMPRLSDTMQQGTIVKWNVKEGQKVKSGDLIADIETDKATMELQSFDDGVVAKLVVPQGQTVPVGTVMMLLATPGEDAASIAKSSGGAASPVRASQSAGGGTTTPTFSQGSATATLAPATPSNGHAHDRVFASPLARKIAEEAGLDLSRVQGSGPGGRIVRKDVEEAIAAGGPSVRGGDVASVRASTSSSESVGAARSLVGGAVPQPALDRRTSALVARRVPLSNMRRVIAQRLSESKASVPHYQVTVDVDMGALMALRGQLNEQLSAQGVKLSVNDFLVRACALAMHEHPYVNSRWAGDAIEYMPEVNVGVAIALPVQQDGTGGGLVVATLRNADQIGLRQISSQTKSLSEKARAKGLSPQEMSDATFTISNLGMFGVSHFNAIINTPNTAILAVGAALDKPVVKNTPEGKQVVPGLVMSMTMSSDHRVVDGAMAAQYLSTVKQYLEKPATLLV